MWAGFNFIKLISLDMTTIVELLRARLAEYLRLNAESDTLARQCAHRNFKK